MGDNNGNNGNQEPIKVTELLGFEGGQNNSSPNSRMNSMNSMNSTRKNLNMAGGAKVPAKGTKAQVWHGTARHTSGGLTKKDLMKTKKGRIVSRKKHAAGKKALKNLVKAGYKAKKGTFKLFKK
jgi:hypothetical protein